MMIRFLVFIMACFCLKDSQAQLNSRIEVEATFGFSNRIYTLNPNYEPVANFNPSTLLAFLNEVEKSSLGKAYGVRYMHPISPKIDFVTGSQFLSLNFSLKLLTTSDVDDPRLNDQNVIFSDAIGVKAQRSLRFLNVPLGLSYFINKKRSIFLSGVLNFGYYLNSKNVTIYEFEDSRNEKSKSITRSEKYSKLHLLPELDVGFEKKISERFNLNFSLNGMTNLSSGTKADSALSERWFLLGFKMAISLRI